MQPGVEPVGGVEHFQAHDGWMDGWMDGEIPVGMNEDALVRRSCSCYPIIRVEEGSADFVRSSSPAPDFLAKKSLVSDRATASRMFRIAEQRGLIRVTNPG